MKAIDFLEEWDKNHTSQPSYQDAIDWARKEMINKACMWIDIRYEYPYCTEIIEDFRKFMEDHL